MKPVRRRRRAASQAVDQFPARRASSLPHAKPVLHRRGPLAGATLVTAERPPVDLARENAYLKQRLAQAEIDISDLNAELGRLREASERLAGRRAARAPNPLGSGQ